MNYLIFLSLERFKIMIIFQTKDRIYHFFNTVLCKSFIEIKSQLIIRHGYISNKLLIIQIIIFAYISK